MTEKYFLEKPQNITNKNTKIPNINTINLKSVSINNNIIPSNTNSSSKNQKTYIM